MTKLVACSEFVKRQTAESGYSHYRGSWEELEALVKRWFIDLKSFRHGYRDGVVLVDLPAVFFKSAIVDLNEKSKLLINYAARREGELPFIRVSAKGDKQVANHASAVLYRKDVLEENNERSTDADWEIICIKARVSSEEDPIDPYTMARNFLHLDGGTKGNFSAEQFAQSIVYWNSHAMTVGKPKWFKKIMEWCRDRLYAVGMHFWENPPKY